jgi:O-antigen/teichoic acid export membrane protein
MADGLAHASVTGVAWTMLRVIGQSGVGIVVTIVLARLLPVDDFGVMAMAWVFIGLAELFATHGIEGAVIQRKELTQRHIDVAVTLSMCIATVLGLAYGLGANRAAEFFREPRLAPVLQTLALGQWFAAMAMVPRGLLRRQLAFKRLFQIELGSYLVGYALTGITLALAGMGVWSLVFGTCVWFGLSCVLAFASARLRIRPALHKQEALDLLGFGLTMTASGLLDYIGVNAGNIIVGRFLGSVPLGLYSRAQQTAALPLQRIAVTLSGVMFPIYASIQSEHARLEQAYLRTVAATALLTLPLLAGAAVSAEWVIVGLYGEQWRAAAPVFALFCGAGMLINIFHLAGAVVVATNHVTCEVWRQAVNAGIVIVGCLAVAKQGILMIAAVYVLGSFWLYVSMGALGLRIVGSTWRRYLGAQAGGVAVALAVAAAEMGGVRLLQHLAPLPASLGLACLVALGAVVYLLCILAIPDRYIFGAKRLIWETVRSR